MIPNQWYAVLESREVPRGRPVGVTRLGERLVFWRDRAGRLACLRDPCLHRGAALSAGCVQGDHVQCPFHGFEYDAQGRCQHIPAHGRGEPVPERFKAHAYAVQEAHGFVFLWWGAAGTDRPPVPFFEDLAQGWHHATFQDPWPVHYSRAVENQLDVMHLPFVHRTTIGRGGRTVVDGPRVEWVTPDRLRFHVFNRRDDGTPPRPGSDLDPARSQVWLELQLPNLWQNAIGDRMRVMAAFAPVDEEHTVIYLRLYQRLLGVPGLRHLLHGFMQRANRVILAQDKRVVVTQRPRRTALHMDELLVAGDRPIVEYRRRRQALKDAARGDAPAGPAAAPG